MKCPNCNETLLISDKNGIEIDYCPTCRGIWLDRGELDKIIERSAAYDRPSESYREESYRNTDKRIDDDYRRKNPHKRKRSSFLDDLFDF